MQGMFRGICVDNRDPKNLGRIRVQVPQILGTSTSGWAFPAWSFNETTLWPQDRLPQPSQGVWVMFDSTSPDKMIWLAAFGSLPLINQPDFVEMPEFKSIITMTLTGTPTWNTVVVFDGTLSSDLGGIPNPNPLVQLSGRKSGGDWTVLGSDIVSGDGTWLINHLVRLTGLVEYRAVFEGVGVYSATSSDIVTVQTPVVTFPTTLTCAMTDPSPALNKKVKFAGRLTTGGSPPVGYGIPKPNAKVNLMARAVGGTWGAAASNNLVNAATGDWSADYTISIPGAVEYQATFAELEIFLASQSPIVTINTSVGTTVSTPTLPALTHGTAFSVSGTVTVASSGAAVSSGTVELWWRNTVGGSTGWQRSGASGSLSGGNYSLTHPALTILGATEWQVRYLGSATADAANSAAVAGTISLPAMGALTKGEATYTYCSFSWGAISGAVKYEVLIWNNSQWIWKADVAAGTTSYTATGLSANTQYFWCVRAVAVDNVPANVYNNASANITNRTGLPASSSSGTSAWINISLSGDDSYRNDGAAWGDVTDMRQGYYSSPYGGEGYTGVALYKGSTVRDKIIATIGSGPHTNGTCSAAEISMTRQTAVGDYSKGVTVTFYRSTTLGNTQGKPDRLGTPVNRTAAVVTDGATWYDIGTAHGQSIGDGDVNSIVIYRNTAADYAAFHAQDLRLKWTWNYVSSAGVTPQWM